jgi:hypothetical protein
MMGILLRKLQPPISSLKFGKASEATVRRFKKNKAECETCVRLGVLSHGQEPMTSVG